MTVNKYKPQFENGNLKKDFVPYTQILTKVLQSNIDPCCLAVWVSLQSRPENWQLSPLQLQKQFGFGKTKVYSILNKLIELKLIERVQLKDNDQKFCKTLYHIKDGQEFLINQHSYPLPSFPETDDPEPAKQEHKYNIDLQRKDSKRKERVFSKKENSLFSEKSICPDKLEDINSSEAEKIASEKSLNISEVATKFMSYAKSSGWVKNNWKAAFVKWVIDEKITSLKTQSFSNQLQNKSTVQFWGPGHPSYDAIHISAR